MLNVGDFRPIFRLFGIDFDALIHYSDITWAS